ncbi:hypothetical protein F5887DRAFT_914458 [Amanita rubescens]|nr:hypothetical protein F5887DRAFT_914458 [Amanita rubescens]
MAQWIPQPFNLLEGNPFEYSEHAISSISGTEAFEKGIKIRDRHLCVVCGYSQLRALNYCHIIPKVEDDTQRRFVFINHSQSEDLEVHHGKAINLDASDDRLPFHGAFLFHEMRVRGYWPLHEDRAIPLPIRWVDWLATDDDDDNDGDDRDSDGDNGDGGGRGGRGRRGRRGGHGGQVGRGRGERGDRGRGDNNETSGRLLRSHGPVPGSSASGKVFIPSNPFTDPASLKALKESFAQQPNWKAAVREGTTWEGNADENAAKWLKLNRIEG